MGAPAAAAGAPLRERIPGTLLNQLPRYPDLKEAATLRQGLPQPCGGRMILNIAPVGSVSVAIRP